MANLVTEEYDGGQYKTTGSFSPNPAKSLFRLRSRRRAGRSAAHDELARPGVGAHLDATEEGEFRIAVKKHTLLQMYHACD